MRQVLAERHVKADIDAASSPRTGDYGSISARLAWYALALMAALVAMSLINRGMLSVIAQPLSQELGLGDRQLGLLMGAAFAILYALFGLPISQLLDRGSRVRLLGLGAVLWGVACMISGFASGFVTLALCRGLLAIGEAVLTPAAVSLIPDLFPRGKRALPMSIYFAMPALAMSLTYVVGGAALDLAAALQGAVGLTPWRMALVLTALPSIILGGLVLTTVKEPQRDMSEQTSIDYGSMRAATRFFVENKRFYVGFYIGMASASALWMGVIAWLPTALVRAYGYSPAQASYYLGLIGVSTTLVGSYFWPALAAFFERRGRSRARGVILVGTMLGVTLSSVGLLSGNIAVILTCFAWMSFAIAAISPTGSMALQSVTPPGLRARATAVYTFLISAIAFSLGAYVVAELADGLFSGRRDALLWGAVSFTIAFGILAIGCFLVAMKPIAAAIRREIKQA